MNLKKNFASYFMVFAGICTAFVGAKQTKYFSVSTIIQNHFSETTMQSEILNDENATAQIKFHIMLPGEAYITSFDMIIDGETYSGIIEEKEAAKKKFNKARRRGQTAGLVESREKSDKIFATDVNIAANTAVTFKLVYQEFLKSIGGKYTSKVILFGDSLSEFLTVDVYICESRAIRDVNVPPILLNHGRGSLDAETQAQIKGNTAHVKLTGTQDLINAAVAGGGGVFSVSYILEKSENGADVIVDNGYFIYFGPDIPIQPKRVIFCLDDSGSMAGHKSKQVKQAMVNILSKLLPEDRFGIIKFSSSTRSWRSTLRDANAENIKDAIRFVKGRDESGSTGIWIAFRDAMKMMEADTSGTESKPEDNLIILLSDGQGDLAGELMLNNVNKENKNRFIIHTISFGQGADDAIMQRVAAANGGRWKKILDDLDAALQIENYVGELRSYINNILPEVVKYPEVVQEYFGVVNQGDEMMTVGRLREDLSLYSNGPHEILFNPGTAIEGMEIISSNFYLDQVESCSQMEGNTIERFAAKAFQMTKVETILKELQLAETPEEKAVLKQKAINMSLEFNLVTSVTSLLVIKPENHDELAKDLTTTTVAPTTVTTTTAAATTTTPAFLLTRGASAGSIQRKRPMWSLHSDPHFLARLSDDVSVCFNWIGRNNEVVNLLHDYENSIVVNGLITGDQKQSMTTRLFVTKMVFLLEEEDLRFEIDSYGFLIANLNIDEPNSNLINVSFGNLDQRSFVFGIFKISIAEMKRNRIDVNIRIKKTLFVIEIHYHHIGRPNSRNHLDLIIPDYETNKIGGLFGHLQGFHSNGNKSAIITKDEKKNRMFLLYNDDKIEVKQSSMKLPYLRERVNCWMAKGHLQHLFGSKLRSFKLASLSDIPAINTE